VHVDPAYTSQGCSACGHVAKANRPNQSTFRWPEKLTPWLDHYRFQLKW